MINMNGFINKPAFDNTNNTFIYTKPDNLSYLSIKIRSYNACFPLSLINIDSEGPDCISQV